MAAATPPPNGTHHSNPLYSTREEKVSGTQAKTEAEVYEHTFAPNNPETSPQQRSYSRAKTPPGKEKTKTLTRRSVAQLALTKLSAEELYQLREEREEDYQLYVELHRLGSGKM